MPAPRSPVIVGRRAELATALNMVDAAARGRGGAVLITGEAGVGKSRLVDEMRARAVARGLTVLAGRSVEGGGAFRAMTEALARLVRRDPVLADPVLRPYRAALRRLLPSFDDVTADDTRTDGTRAPEAGAPEAGADPLAGSPDPTVMLGEGVLALLAGRACLLVLEDLHWADPDTLDLVRYLAGAASDTPVLLVLTARDDMPSTLPRLVPADVRHLALRRLDADGVAALAAACRGEPLPEAQLRELTARSEGLPLLVEELLTVEPGEVPPSFAELVAGRLAALPASARPLVVAAAVVGGDPDWRLLAAMDTAHPGVDARPAAGHEPGDHPGDHAPHTARHGPGDHPNPAWTSGPGSHPGDHTDPAAANGPGDHADPPAGPAEKDGRPDLDDPGGWLVGSPAERGVLAALRAAVEVGLLVVADGRLRWRHALTRDAVLATLVPPERAAIAARAARVLDGRGDRAVAARLYLEAGERARGAAILVGLARADVGRGALRSAAALLDTAGDDASAVDRVLVLTLLGRAADALETGERALPGARGDEHAELCLALARAAIVAGRWAPARRHVERAGRPDDPRSPVLLADAAYGTGDVALAERLSRAAADVVTDPALLCEALSVLSRSTFTTEPAGSNAVLRRVAQVAAEHGLVPWRVQALFGLGSHEHTVGDPVAPSLHAARELALEAGLLGYVVQADLLRANAVLLVEGPVAALPLLRETAERAGRLRLTGLQAMAELMAAADAGMALDERAMAELLAAATSRPDPPTEVTTLGPMVRAMPHLMRHDLPRAAALVDEAVPDLLRHGSAIPIDHIGLWVLLRTFVGDDAARATLRDHKVIVGLGIRAALWYADAIAAGRAGQAAAATALFEEADAMIAHLPWWNGLLRSIPLEAAVVDGWGDPVPALRADLAAHEAAGADGLARTCRDLLRAAGAPSRRRGGAVAPALRARGITAREAEVLALVAAGLTNAETAERLFLSRRTVETHVARLLAKTGATDRSELRRWT